MFILISKFILCHILILECQASTHWIVTEEGRIQAQMDSIYSLKRPDDLVALLQQEKRAVLIEELKEQLMMQKVEIDRREDKETNLESKIYATDEDCIAAELPLTEIDLYPSTVLSFPFEEYDDEVAKAAKSVPPDTKLKEPNCSETIDLDFSMHTFEHLIGVRYRNNLSMSNEEPLQAVIPVKNVNIYGHVIQEALEKNKTSYVHFNMAAYYWRIKGNALNAVECVRRALHFSPREVKYVALVSLGNILHQSHMSEEAAIVIHAAVDSIENEICYVTLGNIYAVLGDYNKSAECFQNAIKVNAEFADAKQRYHAILCHSKIEKALEAQHISLQKTLAELREYQKQHEYWLQQHEKLLNEQAPPEVKLEQRLEYEEQKIRESLDGRGQDCFQFEQNGHMVLSCNMRREAYRGSGSHPQVDLSLNLQLLQAIESRAGRLGQKMAARTGEQCHRT